MFRSSYCTRRHRNTHVRDEQPVYSRTFFTKATPQAVQRKPDAGFFQTKLSIGQPDDKYEKEADAVASEVVSQTALPVVQQKKSSGIQRMSPPMEEERFGTNDQRMRKDKEIQEKPELQRMCPECEEEKEKAGGALQTKVEGSTPASSQLSSRIDSVSGKGNRLPPKTLHEMNASFGVDFSGVTVHNDSDAVNMNRELHAQAFTHGRDIYFNSGKYNPQSAGGKHLLAHELTHVIQQNGIEGEVQRQPSASAEAESQVENDKDSFSIILARHYLATERNVPFDPAQTTTCAAVSTNSNECLLVTQSGTNIKLIWNTETNRAIAKAIINNEGLACGFSYTVDDTSNITFTLIKCWKIFDI